MSSFIEDAESKLIRERAAEWVCELQEDAPERHAAFSKWLRQSPRHVEEFLFAATAWRALDEVGPPAAAEVQRAIAHALSLAAPGTANVVQLQNDLPTPPSAARAHRMRWAAGIAAFAVTAALGWWGISALHSGSVYATEVGEQRTVRLADGSVLYLNSESRVRVQFSRSARNVQLFGGEALFVVAHEPSRPFVVAAGTTVIQAVGTQFDVNREPSGTTVSVLEGRVNVFAQATRSVASPSPQPLQLVAAGEAATIGRNGRIVKHSMQAATDVVAWRERRLVFRGETLEDVINSVNRYSPRHFRIEGDIVRNRRFAGTFSADDPQALVRFLEQYDDLAVETTPGEFIIRMR